MLCAKFAGSPNVAADAKSAANGVLANSCSTFIVRLFENTLNDALLDRWQRKERNNLYMLWTYALENFLLDR